MTSNGIGYLMGDEGNGHLAFPLIIVEYHELGPQDMLVMCFWQDRDHQAGIANVTLVLFSLSIRTGN